jgi:hypothetical protein
MDPQGFGLTSRAEKSSIQRKPAEPIDQTMKLNQTESINGGELIAIRRELSQIKGLLIALLVIVAMATFLPQWILGFISVLVLLLAVGYVILLPIDRLVKRKIARFDEEIERKVLESVGADSCRRNEH